MKKEEIIVSIQRWNILFEAGQLWTPRHEGNPILQKLILTQKVATNICLAIRLMVVIYSIVFRGLKNNKLRHSQIRHF